MLQLLKLEGIAGDDYDDGKDGGPSDEEKKLMMEIEDLQQKIKDKRFQLNENNRKEFSLLTDMLSAEKITNKEKDPKYGNPSMKLNTTLKGHFGKVQALAWASQSNELVSASQDGKMLVWNVQTGNKRLAMSLSSAWTMCCDWSKDGTLIACGGLDNVCSIYDIENEHVGWVSKVYIDLILYIIYYILYIYCILCVFMCFIHVICYTDFI